MLFTVADDLQFCKELDLTPGQLMFVKMLVRDPTFDDPGWKIQTYKLSKMFEETTSGLTPDEISDLISRDIIIDHNEIGKTQYDYYEINPEYAHKFSLKVYPMPYELFDRYPDDFSVGGRKWIGRNASAEEISKDYLRAIANDPEEHKKVIEDLEWAKKNNGIVVGLRKFVTTHYWKVIRKNRIKVNNQASDVTIV